MGVILMNKILKETIRSAKKLQRKGIIYIGDNIALKGEINYQVIAIIVEDLDISMDKGKYETLKNDKEKLLYETVFSSFSKDDLIYNFSSDFKMNIIKEFIDLEAPILIDGIYHFMDNYENLRKLYEKALIQIEDGKFTNFIF